MTLYFRLIFSFSRAVKTKTLKETLEANNSSALSVTGKVGGIRKIVSEELEFAKRNIHMPDIPEKAMRRAQQVLSRYPAGQVRDMGKDFTTSYFYSHCLEKPTSFDGIHPFTDGIDLLISETQRQKLLENKIYLSSEKKLQQIESQSEKKMLLGSPVSLLQLPKNPNDQTTTKSPAKDPQIKGMDFSIEYTQNAALGYVYKRLPKTYAVAKRVLSEFKKQCPNFKPKNFLDYNAKAGSATIAIEEIFGTEVEIFSLEQSKIMKKIGKHITQDIDNSVWISSLVQTINYPSTFKFDAIFCSYYLTELQSEEGKISFNSRKSTFG